jgi:hypothetical protein
MFSKAAFEKAERVKLSARDTRLVVKDWVRRVYVPGKGVI